MKKNYQSHRKMFDHNENNKNGIALQYFHAKISYQTLFGRVEECAKALLAAGINCGDCLCIYSWTGNGLLYGS